jgi:hypothetical protein
VKEGAGHSGFTARAGMEGINRGQSQKVGQFLGLCQAVFLRDRDPKGGISSRNRSLEAIKGTLLRFASWSAVGWRPPKIAWYRGCAL